MLILVDGEPGDALKAFPVESGSVLIVSLQTISPYLLPRVVPEMLSRQTVSNPAATDEL